MSFYITKINELNILQAKNLASLFCFNRVENIFLKKNIKSRTFKFKKKLKTTFHNVKIKSIKNNFFVLVFTFCREKYFY